MAAGLRLVPFALAVLLGGCESSIYRTDYLDGGKSVVTDAKQRIVTNTKGNVSWGKNRPKRIVCAEPSPDVAEALSKAISASFAGAAQGRGNVNAEVSASMSTAVVQLGERLATVQLLRDGLYRACEAYSNGAISDATYSLIVSRVDQTMVALLGMEMAAGAFGRDLAAIGGSAGGNTGLSEADKQEVEKLRQQEATAAGEVAKQRAIEENANKRVADLNNDLLAARGTDEEPNVRQDINENIAARDDARAARAQAEATVATTRGQIAELQSVSSFSSTTARAGGGAIGGSAGNAAYVAQIQQTFTDQDKLGPLLASCVTALDSSSVYKAHVHRGQDIEPDRDAEGNLLPTGPRTTPLSDLCFRMMVPNSEGKSVLTGLFEERNNHAARLQLLKTTKDVFDLYHEKCSAPGSEKSYACKNLTKMLAEKVL
ncbi:MAG: hypothetical protein ACKVP5_01985 [Aestuariivirga sp.]